MVEGVGLTRNIGVEMEIMRAGRRMRFEVLTHVVYLNSKREHPVSCHTLQREISPVEKQRESLSRSLWSRRQPINLLKLNIIFKYCKVKCPLIMDLDGH